MKSEHEKLKEICDKIWYEFHSLRKEVTWISQSDQSRYTVFVDIDEREIIFTQEFIDKYINYIGKWHNEEMWIKLWPLDNLDNPTEYLYNLIK